MAEYIKRANKACRELNKACRELNKACKRFNDRLKPIVVALAKAIQKAGRKGKSNG